MANSDQERAHEEWADARLRKLDEGDVPALTGYASVLLPGNGFPNLPECFALLAGSLRHLDLARNSFTALPEALLALSGLRSLNLQANQIAVLPPSFGAALSHLESLNLSENDLTDLSALAGLHHLAVLHVQENRLGEADEAVGVPALPALHTLDMRQNRLRIFPAFESGGMPSLRDLTLRGNELKTAPLDWSNFSALRFLDLGDNAIAWSSPIVLTGASQMEHLDLCYNALTGVPLFDDCAECNLTHLQLRNNRIDHVHLDRKLTKLVSLDLSNNLLSQLPPEVARLTAVRLEELLVNDNVIVGLPDFPLDSPTFCLKRCDIRGNRITFADVKIMIDLDFGGRLNMCNFYETVPQKILDEGMYLGSGVAARNVAVLDRIGITHVVNAAEGREEGLYPNRFKYLTLQMHDDASQDIALAMEEAQHFIDDAFQSGGAVLVHCQAGVSRSVAIASSYLMKNRGMSVDEALSYIQERRPHAKPIQHFIQQLRRYERTLRK